MVHLSFLVHGHRTIVQSGTREVARACPSNLSMGVDREPYSWMRSTIPFMISTRRWGQLWGGATYNSLINSSSHDFQQQRKDVEITWNSICSIKVFISIVCLFNGVTDEFNGQLLIPIISTNNNKRYAHVKGILSWTFGITKLKQMYPEDFVKMLQTLIKANNFNISYGHGQIFQITRDKFISTR